MRGKAGGGRRSVETAAARAEREAETLQSRVEHEVGVVAGEERLMAEFERAYGEAFFGATPADPGNWREIERTAARLERAREGYARARARLGTEPGERPATARERAGAQRVIATYRELRTLEGRLDGLLGARLRATAGISGEINEPAVEPGVALGEAAGVAAGRGHAVAERAAAMGLADAGFGGAGHVALAAESEAVARPGEAAGGMRGEVEARRLGGGELGLWAQAAQAADEVRLGELLANYEASRRLFDQKGDGRGGRAALAELTAAELELDRFEFDQRRELHAAMRTDERVAAELTAAEGRAARLPDAANLLAYERAALRARELEARREALEARVARLEERRLGREAERLEPGLTRRPTRWKRAAYVRLLHRKLSLARGYGAGKREERAGDGPGAAGGGGAGRTVRAARQRLEGALKALEARPSVEALGEVREAVARHHAAMVAEGRREFGAERRTARKLLTQVTSQIERLDQGTVTQPSEYRDELVRRRANGLRRYLAAQADVELGWRWLRINADGGSGAGLDGALARLRWGDLTAESLARLGREAALALRAATGRMPAPVPVRAARDGPAAALAELPRLHRALLGAAREVRRRRLRAQRDGAAVRPGHGVETPGAAAVGGLERLRGAVADYQGCAAAAYRLAVHVEAPGSRRVLPAAAFLGHPRFAGAPERAALAWTAHAMRQGVAPMQAAASLAQGAAWRSAPPRVISMRCARAATAAVGRWLSLLYKQAQALVLVR
ncbi:MAG TPA: hypothetical protein VHQ90_03415 [Thermoanaerobaculia bacterium]|nr:hypothetical protein [Thermoanaerobaculia bacterium]